MQTLLISLALLGQVHSPARQAEHDAVMALVPIEQATVTAVRSGSWNDPATWGGESSEPANAAGQTELQYYISWIPPQYLSWFTEDELLALSVFGRRILPAFQPVPGGGDGEVPGDGDLVHIPAGIEVEVDHEDAARMTWVRVDGVLSFHPDADTRLSTDLLVITEEGWLVHGDPLGGDGKSEIVIQDTPLRADDPTQIGNGLIVFGGWTSHGNPKTTWTQHIPTQAGATTLIVQDATGWQVGDELILPDERFSWWRKNLPSDLRRRESPVYVAAVAGNVVALSKPLDFEHLEFDGVAPYVANCTRSVTIRSENPLGVRGHVIFLGHAHVDLNYTAFAGLGRTLPLPLDDTTNKVGRYGPHWHHVHGHTDVGGYTGRAVGCFAEGTLVSKWGFVQHGTNNLLFQENVARDFIGACFVTEDGNETGGEFRKNLAYASPGNGINGRSNIIANNPGAEGAGWWLHGSQHTMLDNVALNCQAGISVVHRNQVITEAVDSPNTKFIDFDDFTAIGCTFGIELWLTPTGYWMRGVHAVNCNSGAMMGSGQGSNIEFYNSRFYLDASRERAIYPRSSYPGVQSGGYAVDLHLEDCEIEGFDFGVLNVGGVMSVVRSRFKNYKVNVNGSTATHLPRQVTRFDSVILERALPTTIHVIIGQGGDQLDINHLRSSNDHLFLNWQGTGKDYRFHENYVAPPEAIELDGVLYAKAVLLNE